MSTNVIRLSKETIKLLKNFSSINQSMAFKKGNVIKTIAPSGYMIAEATIPEEFPQDFSIYELAKFLNVFSFPTMQDAELHFSDDEKVSIISGPTRLNYRFTNTDFVKHPDKKIVIRDPDVSFEIKESLLDSFLKVCDAFKHTMVVIRVNDGKVTMLSLIHI